MTSINWHLLFFLLFFGLLSGCWKRQSQTEQSELDAITAASKNFFGKNVRGYMWALTTDTPSLFSQAPVSFDAFEVTNAVVLDPFANRGAGSSSSTEEPELNPFKGLFYQCWYYAETSVYEKHNGESLKKLFLDKRKTTRVNETFLDVRALYEDLEQSERLKNLEAFAISALPGTCFLFNALGPLKGSARGALSSAMCSLSLASLSVTRKPASDGWGSDRARQHIQDQLKAKISELHEVNWDVLSQLRKKVSDFNAIAKSKGVTQAYCPANEPWVARLMDAD
ncbi:MAG: hypothetical protein RJB13_475 [Pseudomonadota bacterium]